MKLFFIALSRHTNLTSICEKKKDNDKEETAQVERKKEKFWTLRGKAFDNRASSFAAAD